MAMLLMSQASAQSMRKLPSITVKAANGKTVDIATLTNDGKPMVVFAWEITCQPCIAAFNAIAPQYKNWQEETGVKIVAISIDDNRSAARVFPMARSKGWGFDVYLDPNQAFKRAMNVPFCPYVYVLDSDGAIVWQKGGYTAGDENIIYEMVNKVAQGKTIE